MNKCRYTPCDKCPFLRDSTLGLNEARYEEIAMGEGLFYCHETTVVCEETGESLEGPNTKVCAGFLSFRENMEQPNQMMRILERIGGYDMRKLTSSELVCDDLGELEENAL